MKFNFNYRSEGEAPLNNSVLNCFRCSRNQGTEKEKQTATVCVASDKSEDVFEEKSEDLVEVPFPACDHYSYDLESMENTIENLENKLKTEHMYITEKEINWDTGKLLRRGTLGDVHIVRWRGSDCCAQIVRPESPMLPHCAIDDGSEVEKKYSSKAYNEVKFLTTFRHPSIIKLLGSYIDNSNMLILTEVYHSTLESVIEDVHIPHSDILTYATEIAQAMAYIHGHSILHGDLNPASIFISNGGMVKLGNFSRSKFLKSSTTNAGDLESLQDLVSDNRSVRYIAPEILSRNKYGKKADVYSFGMIFFAVLTRSKPFAEIKMGEIVAKKVIMGERPSIPAGIDGVDIELLESLWNQIDECRPDFLKVIVSLLRKPSFCCLM